MLRRTLILGLAMGVVACASSTSAGPRRSRDLITAEEVARVQVGTAYEVVESLRPEYLRTRGSSMAGAPEVAIVYIDGVRAGGPQELRRVPREIIQEIRYISGSDATTRFGTGHGGGAIMITTRR